VLSKNFSPFQIETLHTELRACIEEIGNFVVRQKINCGFQRDGSLVVARNGGQMARLQRDISVGDVFLNAEQTRARISMTRSVASVFNADCAVVNPAALVVGLAKSLENRGVAIFEGKLATITHDKNVLVDGFTLKTEFVLRATEAYLESTRVQIPIYSLIVATEPLADSAISEIGFADRESFAEGGHLVTYAQRTEDNRLVIGGRGAPYAWGSRRSDRLESRPRDHARLRNMARDWFPVLEKFKFTHAWGGAVGVTRDWSPYVRVNNGYGEMGGYVGDGVTLSYLAAHSMADRILKKDSVRANLPYVNWQGRKWEMEPVRWLAVNSTIQLTKFADREENITNSPSVIMRILDPLLGR
jgi:glycine/D-amino acid oxidase-like deaminating enzyme